MEFHILDAGPTKYGDCILGRKGDDLILIDGGHPGDERERTDRQNRKRAALQDQIASILRSEPPFRFKLLVVTHAHLDHIGCLPALVKNEIISAEWALVADEKFGWGKHVADDAAPDGSELPQNARALLAALREDAVPNLSDDAEIQQFLTDAATLEQRYRTMLQKLKEDGTKIVRYGRNSTKSLLTAFKAWNMVILGPTRPHVIACADEVRQALSDAAMAIRDQLQAGNLQDATGESLVSIYRRLLSSPTLADGENSRPGHALNDQSIVLAFGKKEERVLLAGDMQFVAPGFNGVKGSMKALWQKVKGHGEYVLVKTCHHTSHNAFDEQWMRDMGNSAVYVHSGGENNVDHPSEEPLNALEARASDQRSKWFRNDRNGRVSCVVSDGKVKVSKERGKVDDFSPNHKDQDALVVPSGPSAEIIETPPELTSEPHTSASDHVEVNIKLPHRRTRVTVTIDVDPEVSRGRGDQPPNPGKPSEQLGKTQALGQQKLGGGRRFPRLLAVTDLSRLTTNVGKSAAETAVHMLREAGLDVIVDLPTEAGSAGARKIVADSLRGAEREGGGYLGVLIVGGHDVVPHVVVDALPKELRTMMRSNPPAFKDQDDYIVWSDHPYGDVDGKGANEVPVSRVPDGHSADLLITALGAPARQDSDSASFGLRNLNRPFAEQIYARFSESKCLTSAKVGPQNVPRDSLNAHRVYLMLHGSAEDATFFNGEIDVDDDTQIPAMDLSSLPENCSGAVVFTGCCWGALTLDRTAANSINPGGVKVRTISNSIALAFLQRGARAYIGCTGSHYSPDVEPYAFFGGPMHQAFWQAMRDPRMCPALALHEARVAYLNGIPHGRSQLTHQAIEYKIFHQFTCLGIGW